MCVYNCARPRACAVCLSAAHCWAQPSVWARSLSDSNWVKNDKTLVLFREMTLCFQKRQRGTVTDSFFLALVLHNIIYLSFSDWPPLPLSPLSVAVCHLCNKVLSVGLLIHLLLLEHSSWRRKGQTAAHPSSGRLGECNWTHFGCVITRMEGGGGYLAPDDLRSKVNAEHLERSCSNCVHSFRRTRRGRNQGGFPVTQGNGFCCFPSVLKLSAYVMYVCITEQDFSLAA